MKTLKLTTLLLAAALVFGSTSCKYEEGPAISLRSKKARVVGEWEIEKTIEEDGEIDTDWEGFEIKFDDDGTGVQSYTFTLGGVTSTSTDNFSWEFSDSKKNIKITDEDGDVVESKILKLKNDEMWIEDLEDGYKTYFIAK